MAERHMDHSRIAAVAKPWRDPTATPFVRIRSVTKRFGNVIAVNNVSLDIFRGELFCLLGGSGSGKSTLLRMMAGFEEPTAGSIEIDGQDMAGVPPYARPINMMFQSYALFPHMSVEANVGYGLRRAGMPAGQIDQFIVERGVIIALLDLTVVSLGSGRLNFGVLFAIGMSMACMAGLRRLSTPGLLALGIGWFAVGEVITGLGRIVELVRALAHRLQIQEFLVRDIARTIEERVGAKGVFVRSRAVHLCVHSRGPSDHTMETVCTYAVGSLALAQVSQRRQHVLEHVVIGGAAE